MSSTPQRRVAVLEQDDAGDNPQAEMAAAREYYADPRGSSVGLPLGKGTLAISQARMTGRGISWSSSGNG